MFFAGLFNLHFTLFYTSRYIFWMKHVAPSTSAGKVSLLPFSIPCIWSSAIFILAILSLLFGDVNLSFTSRVRYLCYITPFCWKITLAFFQPINTQSQFNLIFSVRMSDLLNAISMYSMRWQDWLIVLSIVYVYINISSFRQQNKQYFGLGIYT